MKNVLITIVVILLFGICGNAQYKFEYLTTKDGLSSNRIRRVFRDSKGYVWIGSETGLDKYDSYTIKQYRHNENQPGTLSNNDVWDVIEDHHKNLWVGTSDGLNLYYPESDSFKVFRNNPADIHSIDNNRISNLFMDSKGNLWILTQGTCLNKWEPSTKQFVRYPIKNSTGYPALREDSKGNLWLVSEGLSGISRFDPKTGNLTTYNDPAIDMGKNSKTLFIDSDDKMWIAPDNEGLFSFDPSTGKFKQFGSNGDGNGTNGKSITRIIEEDDRHLWFGVDQGGINRFDKVTGTFEYIMYNDKNIDGLNNDGIWGIYKDKEGIIWISTSGGGLNIYNPKNNRFKLFRHSAYNPNSVSSNIIGCFHEDSQGMIWIGTDNNGLDVLNPKTGKFESYKHNPANPLSISSNTIRCIIEDENKDLWIGTWNSGFNHLNRKTGNFSCYLPDASNPASLSGPTVWHSIIDHNGIFWLAIHDVGVDLFDKKKGVIKRFIPDPNDPKALSNAKVWYIFEDSNKNIWLCTNDGLNLYDSTNNSFIVYRHLPSLKIKAITEDKDKNLWVGTENGICQMKADGTVLQAYDESNGLAGNIVQGVVCDNSGNLWVSTNKGISRFDPKTKTFKNFTEKEGLQDNAFFQESFLKTREGELYFGGFNGFNSFYPDSIKVNTTIPPVHITDFQIFNKPVQWATPGSPLEKHISETKEITLTHLQSVFSFEFTAINYTNPEKNLYAYKMEGFEDEWNYTDASRRYVSYTNLDPGEYTFRVIASNNDGIWNEAGISVRIIILPPWWKTWWFRLLTVFSFVIILGYIFFSRVQHYKNQKLLLEKLVAKKTSELQMINKTLLNQTEELNQANTILEERQEEIMVQKEELLKVNIELQNLNATKDKFFSIIAHDLKSPFSGILGFSELLKLHFKNWSEEKNLQAINFVYDSSKKLYSLLENLLQWSQTQSGMIEFHPEKIELNDLCRSIIELLEGNAEAKNIKLSLSLSEDKLTVSADRQMLDTIMRNLISNAIKFTNTGGKVDVIAEKDGKLVIIKVTDTGVGMSPKIKDQLFKIETQQSTPGTDNEKGTGLGLLLVKEFINKHGSEIIVESIEGKGSMFQFRLPLAN